MPLIELSDDQIAFILGAIYTVDMDRGVDTDPPDPVEDSIIELLEPYMKE